MAVRRPVSRGERGVTQVIVVFGMVVLIGFAALAIDNGYILATRTQLQSAADAGALAAMGEMQSGVPREQAATLGRLVANTNYAAYDDVEVTEAADVVFGSFDSGSGVFDPSGLAGATAVQVTAQRDLPFLLLPILNLFSSVETGEGSRVAASAVASLGVRDVVIVQDITSSFQEELPEAQQALETFVNAMVAQSLGGDRIGLVAFADEPRIELPLTLLPAGQWDAIWAIRDLDLVSCIPGYPLPWCGGTNIAAALEAASQLFEDDARSADRVIVLVSDGTPCKNDDENTTLTRRAEALAAADIARQAGIRVYTIFLDHGGVTCQGVSANAADPAMMEQLAETPALFYATANESDLDDLLIATLQGMGMRLVK